MKSEKLKNRYSKKELVESFVFRSELTKAQKKSADEELREMRKKLKTAHTSEVKIVSNLLQLKFQIEDYLNNPGYDNELTFGHFLKDYLRSLNKKNKDFANDIAISEAELSQILNKHRDPSEKIMIRLELHSNQTIPATIWYKLLEKEKEHKLATNLQMRLEVKNNVKNILYV